MVDAGVEVTYVNRDYKAMGLSLTPRGLLELTPAVMGEE